VFSIQDMQNGLSSGSGDQLVREFCTNEVQTIFPDETMGVALSRMVKFDIGRLPVVSKTNPKQLVGMISRTQIVQAYDLALSRRAALRHRAQEAKLGTLREEDAGIIKAVIQPGSICEQKAIREIEWPDECVVASIRRGHKLIIPHGDTILMAGDVLIAISEKAVQPEVFLLCQAGNADSQD